MTYKCQLGERVTDSLHLGPVREEVWETNQRPFESTYFLNLLLLFFFQRIFTGMPTIFGSVNENLNKDSSII